MNEFYLQALQRKSEKKTDPVTSVLNCMSLSGVTSVRGAAASVKDVKSDFRIASSSFPFPPDRCVPRSRA